MSIKNSIIYTVLGLILTSCGISKKGFEQKEKEIANEKFLKNELREKAFTEASITKVWWSEFNDPFLDTLIGKARRNNYDINSAIANYKAARAFLKERKLDRLPTVTSKGNYTRTRLGENVFVQGSNPTYNTYNASFDAIWEVDLFGRVSNRIKGAYANSNMALADMHGVYLNILAEVAKNYMDLRGTQYLLDIAKRNLNGQQETYDLTVKLSDAGTSNSLDVKRALAQLETTRASIPLLEANIEALKNSLSVLIGEIPGNLDEVIIKKQPLPSLPSTVALGNIEEMLRRRPDVRRAEAALQVRIAEYNISVADLYPKIEFGGSLGFSAVDFANFGQKESFTWSLVPSISWAAFNLGRVKKQINRNDALTIAAFNQFEKIVIQSLEEIKTAMSNYTKELQRREILMVSSEASAQAAIFAKQRFNAGLDNFIDYLNSENALLQSENALALSEISSATSLIAIYKALGGGWEIISEEEMDKKFEQMRLEGAKSN